MDDRITIHLRFEDRVSAQLRAAQAKMTARRRVPRAEFVRKMCDEVPPPTCPPEGRP